MNKKTALLGLLAGSQPPQLHAAALTWSGNATTAPNPYDGANRWDTVSPQRSRSFVAINAISSGARGITANGSF